jgi:diguanylate cyclase (GGDEF)-like protein
MNKFIISFILIPAIFSFTSTNFEDLTLDNVNKVSESETADSKNSILVLGSYSISWLSYPSYVEGLNNIFGYTDFDLTYEFMNTKEIAYSDDYIDFLDEYYNNIYDVGEFDAVISLDDDALNYALTNKENEDSFLYDTPIFFAGVNDIEYAETAKQQADVYGISEYFDYVAFIRDTLEILPNTEVINYITDSTSTGQGLSAAFESAIAEIGTFATVNVINSSELTYEELGNSIAGIPQNEATYLLACNFDGEGNYYNRSDQSKLIEEFSNSPVFSNNYPLNIEDNPYTGYIDYDYVTAAEIIATDVESMLSGSSDLVSFEREKNLCGYVYDQVWLDYYELEFDHLPQNVTLINESIDFFDEDSSAYKTIAIVAPIVIIFIFSLMYLYFRNRNDNKRLKETINSVKFNSKHDYLTGLLEGELFFIDADELMKQNRKFATIVVDVDNMQNINSFYGRSYGDEVIKSVANKLEKVCGDTCKIYRHGGDKLVVIYEFIEENELTSFVNVLESSGINIYVKEGSNFYISTTIGISVFPKNFQEKQTSADMIDQAFVAMRIGKQKGKKRIEYFDDALQGGKKKSEIYSMLIDSINEDKFELFYQPIVNLKTGEVQKYEALLRIKDNRISPAVFIPIAEETGLILRIGRTVLEIAAQFVTEMNAMNVYKRISTNFSFNQFSDYGYIDFFKKVIKEKQISMTDLDIELTESVLLKVSKEKFQFFNFFSDSNIELSLDDFGTGFSSLNNLFSIPISVVKIDKGLGESLCKNEESSKILIDFFHKAGLLVVIEGIETRQQVEVMKRCNADFIQGYYFSKPLPKEETLKNLQINYMDKII